MNWFGWGIGGGLLPAEECSSLVVNPEGSDEDVDDGDGEDKNDDNVAHYLRYVPSLFFLVVITADENEQNTRYYLWNSQRPNN